MPKMFDAHHALGMFIKNPPPIIEEAYQRHFQILSDFKRYCDSNNIIFIVLLFPQRFQVQSRDWRATIKHYALNNSAFDLELPNKRIQEFGMRNNIQLIDPTQFMKRLHKIIRIDMYCPRGDMYWNKRGHYFWFLGAKNAFEPLILKAIKKFRFN